MEDNVITVNVVCSHNARVNVHEVHVIYVQKSSSFREFVEAFFCFVCQVYDDKVLLKFLHFFFQFVVFFE